MTSTGTQLVPQVSDGALPEGRSLLAHLLHALNQPLTGLQCSLEVALAGPRQTEQYLNTLRDGLDLTARMRILVESIREVADLDQIRSGDVFLLDRLLQEVAEDLDPVAKTRNLQMLVACQPGLPVLADRRFVAALLFRFLESAISLAGEGTELRVASARDNSRVQLAVSWSDGPSPPHSPFSRSELGLLLAQAGWERAGGQWERRRVADTQTCTVRLPIASVASLNGASLNAGLGGPKLHEAKFETTKFETTNAETRK